MEEIPNNHRLDVKKPIMNGISTTNLNWCVHFRRISEPSTGSLLQIPYAT